MGKDLGQQGVTLLELVMVLLVVSLALAISYPSLSRGTVAFHLKATGRSVLNTLRYAREQAITEQRVMKVTIDKQQGTVTLSDDLGDGARTYTLPDDVKIQGLMLGADVVAEGPLTVRFLTNGSSEEAQILLRSRTGGILRVASDPITGGARIFFDRGDFAP